MASTGPVLGCQPAAASSRRRSLRRRVEEEGRRPCGSKISTWSRRFITDSCSSVSRWARWKAAVVVVVDLLEWRGAGRGQRRGEVVDVLYQHPGRGQSLRKESLLEQVRHPGRQRFQGIQPPMAITDAQGACQFEQEILGRHRLSVR